MGKAGMLGFFGAGGLHPRKVKEAINRIQSELGSRPYGFNLLHNPFEPSIEEATVNMYLEHEITRVSASAYLGLTSYLLHYRLKKVFIAIRMVKWLLKIISSLNSK